MEEKKIDILQLFQITSAVLVMTLCMTYIVIDNSALIPFILLFMALINFISGVREYKKSNSLIGIILYFGSALFILTVAIKLL